jgi:hypothetical protein
MNSKFVFILVSCLTHMCFSLTTRSNIPSNEANSLPTIAGWDERPLRRLRNSSSNPYPKMVKFTHVATLNPTVTLPTTTPSRPTGHRSLIPPFLCSDDDVIVANVANPTASMTSLVTLKAENNNGNTKAASPVVERTSESDKANGRRREHHHPFQLPMPAYGGYYATLASSLPSTAQPVSPIQRLEWRRLFVY